MSSVLGDLLDRTCLVYLDDIVIYSADLDQHIIDLREVFQKLREAGLTINREKCSFIHQEMRYLGHIIGQNGVQPDPDKVSSILAYPAPTTVKQLERFLGMAAWFHKFIPNYASVAEPLHQLRRKKVNWQWSDACQTSFDALKRILTSQPILAYPTSSEPFVVHTDASDVGLGAVLLQANGPVKRVIAYASRTLNAAERNYSATEKECLAVVWALEKWRPHLEGPRFKVVTDHQALCWLFRKTKLTGRLARWVLRLQNYVFDVVYRPGSEHYVPDALSRIGETVKIVGVVGRKSRAKHVSRSPSPPPRTIDTPSSLTASSTPNQDHANPDTDADSACRASICIHPRDDVINWIQCDDCSEWYHQKCVYIKKKKAEQLLRYSLNGEFTKFLRLLTILRLTGWKGSTGTSKQCFKRSRLTTTALGMYT